MGGCDYNVHVVGGGGEQRREKVGMQLMSNNRAQSDTSWPDNMGIMLCGDSPVAHSERSKATNYSKPSAGLQVDKFHYPLK